MRKYAQKQKIKSNSMMMSKIQTSIFNDFAQFIQNNF
jgi:hypothetical protein